MTKTSRMERGLGALLVEVAVVMMVCCSRLSRRPSMTALSSRAAMRTAMRSGFSRGVRLSF